MGRPFRESARIGNRIARRVATSKPIYVGRGLVAAPDTWALLVGVYSLPLRIVGRHSHLVHEQPGCNEDAERDDRHLARAVALYPL